MNNLQVSDYFKIKKSLSTERVRRGLDIRPNGRSTDYIAPGLATGCSLACSYCVAEGTLISTPSGLKPVEQIQDGDEVISYDSSSEQLVIARVENTASRIVDQLYVLEVGSQTLTLTGEHPVYIVDKGWVKTEDLVEGDEVLYVYDE